MRFRIGLFNDSFPPTIDGVANATVNYAHSIGRLGGEAIVVTPKYPHVTDNYPFQVYRYPSIPLDQRIGYRAGNPFLPTIIHELRGMNMDLYHTHCPFASAVLVRQLRGLRHRVPVVLTYHTKFDIDINQRVRLGSFRKIVKKFILNNIRSADEVWVVSNGAASSLRSLGYRGAYKVMPNGTDFEKREPDFENMKSLSASYRVDDDCLLFLFVGRMMWYKNTKLIIDALKKIRNEHIKFKMLFVGDGNDRAAMECYVSDIGMSNLIEFTGAVYDRERLRTFYNRADLFMFPSTYDTSGLVVKEAAACGCPSILVKDSCAAEGVEDGFSGYLTEENSDDIAKTIIAATKDLDKLRQVGENASSHVYLSWDDAVAKACERYEEILRSRRK